MEGIPTMTDKQATRSYLQTQLETLTYVLDNVSRIDNASTVTRELIDWIKSEIQQIRDKLNALI